MQADDAKVDDMRSAAAGEAYESPLSVPPASTLDEENALVLTTMLDEFRSGDASAAELVQLLDERFVGAPSRLESTVRSIYAQLTEAPLNLHQTTVFFLSAAEDAEGEGAAEAAGAEAAARGTRRGALLFLTSSLLIFAQTLTAVAVLTGTVMQSCLQNSNCPHVDMFCNNENRCEFCGRAVPLLEQQCGVDVASCYVDGQYIGGTLNHPLELSFVGALRLTGHSA